MKEFTGQFIAGIQRSSAVASFRFKTNGYLHFIPGQFIQLIFDRDNHNNQNLNKYMSFSCAPGKEYIEVTKKTTGSDFSKKLLALKPGDAVLFKGPMGKCVFKEEFIKIGFVIGGIGITPVISILEYISAKSLSTDVYLLYSNLDYQSIPFKKELDEWSSKNNNIKIIHFITDCELKDKNCTAGRIDKNSILNNITDYKDRMIFIFGPPGMVTAMKNMCYEIGCEKDKVHTENFIGY
ncbi:MAG: FAD-dependent oxidoreductase [bacterium]